MKGACVSLSLALRLLRREWWAGELRLLVIALVVAVASMTAVGFFTDRIRLALEQQAAAILGGDLVLTASRRLPPALAREAHAAGLEVAEMVEFPSMVMAQGRAGPRSRLAAVAAVSRDYPLRGELRVAPRPFAPARALRGAPPRGTVWVERRLLEDLGITVGDTLRLGVLELQVAAVLASEPARVSTTLFNVAPRLMLALEDLPATGLLTPASRIRHKLLVAGAPQDLQAFRRAAAPLLRAGERLEGVEAGPPALTQALERARRFLGLAALVSVMLAGIAIAMATRRYMHRHLDACGLLRCLGCSRREILALYLVQLAVLAVAAALAGGVLGYLAQYGLVALLGNLLTLALPPPSIQPWLAGMAVAVIMVAGFSLPLLLHLPRVPALRVLRRELGAPPPQGVLAGGVGMAAFAALVFWQAGEWRLGTYMLGGTLAVMLVLGAAAWLVLRALGGLEGRLSVAWRFAARGLRRRLGSSALQVAAFGIGITVLLLLMVVRNDLLAGWQRQLPPDTPNRFLINIRPQQVAELEAFFAARGMTTPGFYPVVRGRLTAIGETPVTPERYTEEQARRLVAREFNLSWMAAPPAHNRVVAGRWWQAGEMEAALFSVERGLAETLGIALGDLLEYRVGEQVVRGRVVNLREVEWDSFRVNFFVIAPPGLLQDFPTSYISSFYLPPQEEGLLTELVQRFPNVTVIDVAAIMDQVRLVMSRVSLAVEYVFLFTLVAGLLVLYAAIQSTLDERIRDYAIRRALGGSRRQLLHSLATEFLLLGLLASGIAVAAAAGLGGLLAAAVFEVPYRPSWGWLAAAGVVAAVGVGLAGYLGTRGILRRPPLQTLLERT